AREPDRSHAAFAEEPLEPMGRDQSALGQLRRRRRRLGRERTRQLIEERETGLTRVEMIVHAGRLVRLQPSFDEPGENLLRRARHLVIIANHNHNERPWPSWICTEPTTRVAPPGPALTPIAKVSCAISRDGARADPPPPISTSPMRARRESSARSKPSIAP